METTDLEPDVLEAIGDLDDAMDKTAEALERCAKLVDEGRLDGNIVMAKMAELAARLMAGPA